MIELLNAVLSMRIHTSGEDDEIILDPPERIGEKYFLQKSLRLLDHDGGAVCEYFRDALHHFIRIVAHADDGVRSEFACVLHHDRVCFLAGFLAELREEGDVAAEDRLKASSDRAEDVT